MRVPAAGREAGAFGENRRDEQNAGDRRQRAPPIQPREHTRRAGGGQQGQRESRERMQARRDADARPARYHLVQRAVGEEAAEAGRLEAERQQRRRPRRGEQPAPKRARPAAPAGARERQEKDHEAREERLLGDSTGSRSRRPARPDPRSGSVPTSSGTSRARHCRWRRREGCAPSPSSSARGGRAARARCSPPGRSRHRRRRTDDRRRQCRGARPATTRSPAPPRRRRGPPAGEGRGLKPIETCHATASQPARIVTAASRLYPRSNRNAASGMPPLDMM